MKTIGILKKLLDEASSSTNNRSIIEFYQTRLKEIEGDVEKELFKKKFFGSLRGNFILLYTGREWIRCIISYSEANDENIIISSQEEDHPLFLTHNLRSDLPRTFRDLRFIVQKKRVTGRPEQEESTSIEEVLGDECYALTLPEIHQCRIDTDFESNGDEGENNISTICTALASCYNDDIVSHDVVLQNSIVMLRQWSDELLHYKERQTTYCLPVPCAYRHIDIIEKGNSTDVAPNFFNSICHSAIEFYLYKIMMDTSNKQIQGTGVELVILYCMLIQKEFMNPDYPKEEEANKAKKALLSAIANTVMEPLYNQDGMLINEDLYSGPFEFRTSVCKKGQRLTIAEIMCDVLTPMKDNITIDFDVLRVQFTSTLQRLCEIYQELAIEISLQEVAAKINEHIIETIITANNFSIVLNPDVYDKIEQAIQRSGTFTDLFLLKNWNSLFALRDAVAEDELNDSTIKTLHLLQLLNNKGINVCDDIIVKDLMKCVQRGLTCQHLQNADFNHKVLSSIVPQIVDNDNTKSITTICEQVLQSEVKVQETNTYNDTTLFNTPPPPPRPDQITETQGRYRHQCCSVM